MNHGFEILFITEGDSAAPAAEIQFSGQRLCVLRQSMAGEFDVEFLTDLIVGNNPQMQFPLTHFNKTTQDACDGLALWLSALAAGGSGPAPGRS